MRMFMAVVYLLAMFGVSPVLAADDDATEKLKKTIIGKWQATNDATIVVEFKADGKIIEPFYRENGKWVLVEGTYTVEANGKIKFKAEKDGSYFAGTYTFKDGKLTAPRGPAPVLTYEKMKDEKEKKE